MSGVSCFIKPAPDGREQGAADTGTKLPTLAVVSAPPGLRQYLNYDWPASDCAQREIDT